MIERRNREFFKDHLKLNLWLIFHIKMHLDKNNKKEIRKYIFYNPKKMLILNMRTI